MFGLCKPNSLPVYSFDLARMYQQSMAYRQIRTKHVYKNWASGWYDLFSQIWPLFYSFCFQIRVVNAFQEPAAPAQMPLKGRASLASMLSVAAARQAAADKAAAEQAKRDSVKVEIKDDTIAESKAENDSTQSKGTKAETIA